MQLQMHMQMQMQMQTQMQMQMQNANAQQVHKMHLLRKTKKSSNIKEIPSTTPLQAIDKPYLEGQEKRIKPLNNPDDSRELSLLHKVESFPWLLVCVLNNQSNPINLTHPSSVHRLVFHQSGVWCKCKCKCKYKCKCKCECKCTANAKNAHATKKSKKS